MITPTCGYGHPRCPRPAGFQGLFRRIDVVKKNRRFEGVPLSQYLLQPYWHAIGWLSRDITVPMVRYRREYDDEPTQPQRHRGARPLPEATGNRRSHQRGEESRELGVLSNRRQAPRRHAAPPTPPSSRASHRPLSRGVPHCGARTTRPQASMASAQAISHPQWGTGRIASLGAGEKRCVRSGGMTA